MNGKDGKKKFSPPAKQAVLRQGWFSPQAGTSPARSGGRLLQAPAPVADLFAFNSSAAALEAIALLVFAAFKPGRRAGQGTGVVAVGRPGGDAALELQAHHPVVMLAVFLLQVLVVKALLPVAPAFEHAHLPFRRGRRGHHVLSFRMLSAAAQRCDNQGGNRQAQNLPFRCLHLLVPPYDG